MTQGLVSVVIPAFNARATIAETLRSVQSQSFRDLEIIVVDDGSTDGTGDLVAAIARRDDRIRILRQANAGPCAARNRGMRTAQGPYIALLDADDLWHPEKIAHQVDLMETSKYHPALVYCWSWWIDERSKMIPNLCSAYSFRGDTFALFLLRNFIGNGSSPLLRSSVIREVGFFDERLRRGSSEDLDYYIRIADAVPVDVVPEVLVGYRIWKGSRSSNWIESWRSLNCVHRLCYLRHPDLPPRLSRWGKARFLASQARRHAEAGQWRSMIWLLMRAMSYDPLIPLLLRREVSLLAPKAGGERFLPPPPWLADFRPSERPWLDRRRHDFAAAVSSRVALTTTRHMAS